MSWNELIEKVKELPPALQREIAAYIAQKLNHLQASGSKKPVFGSAKGMFILKPEFNEPLEDFKEYME